ncbi:MAG TPA: ATP-binding protein [Sandaracinaceae bacterium LLY-WYZ-13_1]|nr:ATP-binding protein [Sandaracinaceae bacterium LLY-WYZ-13_1]
MKPRRCRHAHPGPHPHRRRGRHKRKLQRRVFLWLGASIVFTAVVVGVLFTLLTPSERFRRDREGFERFVSARVEAVWDDPAARDAFVRDLHEDLALDATLYDASGAVVVRHGGRCEETWGVVPLTRDDGRALGQLEVCGRGSPWGGGWRFLLVLVVAVFVLWGVSGMFARRLLRPLRHLERMARRLAEGDLRARSGMDERRDGELGTLGLTMDRMAERIEKQLADQRELLAAVSHELRTPLGHLRVLLEMARERPSERTVDEIEAEVLEVDALVGQLLASSRVEFGTISARTVDAVELAGRALERAEVDPARLAVEGTPAPIEVDPTLLARALANLLSNAAHHGGGVTRLTLRYEPERVVFAVEDAGPGFAPGEREKVFEAFYRGEHRAGASLGLGLSLVRRIARAHGGDAWIEDAEDGGARVLFSVDAVEE